MALTIKQVAEAHVGVTALVKLDEEDKFLPYKTKLKIATLLRKMKPDNDKFTEERFKLVQTHGTPVLEKLSPEDVKAGKEPTVTGWQVPKDSPKFPEFEKLFAELLADEAELEAIKPLKTDDLGENKLSTGFLMELQDLGVLEKDAE